MAVCYQVAGYQVNLPPGFESEGEEVLRRLAPLAEYVNLTEPFDRIHEAIREAQRLGEEGNEAYARAG